MRFAAIDIGSNAVRLLIKDIEISKKGAVREERIAYYRAPLRLGGKVFDSGRVSSSNAEALGQTLEAFRLLMEVQDVVHYRACATSALRNAENRWKVIDSVESISGIHVECIDGEEEAELIFENFKHFGLDDAQDLLCVDVGGGSTELSLLRGTKRIAWSSFQIGTVRRMNQAVDAAEWKRMERFFKENLGSNEVRVAGTGGNINRFHKLARLKKSEDLSLAKLKKWVERIRLVPLEQRSTKFGLKSNRADVIVPAGEIYIAVLKLAGLDSVWVPKVGLSDGIILRLVSTHHPDASRKH